MTTPALPPLVSYADTNLPTPGEIRTRWCMGLPLTDELGLPMEDEDLQAQIDAAASEVERRLAIPLKPTVVVCNAVQRGLVPDVDFDREEPPYDYDARNWVQYGFLQLRERPVIELLEFKLVLPNYQIVMDFMTRPEWVKLYQKNGQLHIVPYAGDPSLFYMAGSTLSGYPFITGAIQGNIPQMLYVSYVAGYEKGKVPKDIRNIVAKIAAVNVLGIAGTARFGGATSMSTSIDGLSESAAYGASPYQTQMKTYQDSIDAFFDPKGADARGTERGITMTGL